MATPTFQPKRTLKECHDILTKTPGSMFETETILIDGRLETVFVKSWPNLRYFWLNAVGTHSARDYIVYEKERLTYAAVHGAASKAASVFYSAYGVRKGDRIGIVARNIPEWLISFWACQLLGVIAVCVNAWLPISDTGAKQSPLTHCITHTGCKIIIVDAERASVLEKWIAKGQKKTGVEAALVIRSQDAVEKHGGFQKAHWKGMKKWEDVMEAYKGKSDLWQSEEPSSSEDLFAILFTSGTTGLPKGVPISNRGWTTNILNAASIFVRHALRNGVMPPAPDPNAPQNGTVIVGPLFHALALMANVGAGTQNGNKLILMKKWDKETVSDLMESKLRSAKEPPTLFSMGGATVPPTLLQDIMKKFPNAIPGLAGLTNEITIVDTETLKVQKPGVMGEVWIRGSNIMRSYWNDPIATEQVMTKDGWFRSGDLGYMDEEGFLYIKDRVKDVIIRGGENIDSTTVENALYNHPIVLECAAVAVPDTRLGELVAVVVTVREEHKGQLNEKELIEISKTHLPSFAVPVMILELDELVKNAAGKVVKKDLRAIAKAAWEKRRRSEAKAKL
ncbi:hypothetical protein FRB96_000610 [Tulasnella sp. 330]|nr:hypothetical protein FRB96_000610 [Tulasnella sp. 330]